MPKDASIAPARADFPLFRTIPTRWMDNDVYGHVNNVQYYSYFDTAVNAALIEAGVLDPAASGAIGLVVETGCRFFAPLSFPDEVAAGLRVERLGSSSVRYALGLFRGDSAARGGGGPLRARLCGPREPAADAHSGPGAPGAGALDRSAGVRITAAVLDATGDRGPYAESRPLRLAEIELAEPGPGELLVRIQAAGPLPLRPVGDQRRPAKAHAHGAGPRGGRGGDSNGDGVEDLAPGDRVVLAFLPACRACASCLAGEPWMCGPAAAANGRGVLLGGEGRLSEGGAEVRHHLGVSAFASHAVVDRRSAVKVDADIPPEIAALFGCAVLTGVGAVLNTAAVQAGERVAVFGLGGVGLSAVMGAKLAGAETIVAVDPVEAKRDLALELGASEAVTPEAAAEALARLPRGGPDVVIETAGRASVLAAAYAAARRGGRVVTVGLPNPAEMLSIPAVSLVADGKTLAGSYMGSSDPARTSRATSAGGGRGGCRWSDCSPRSALWARSTRSWTGWRAARPSGRS
jgi:alcohol dehydrogenase